jgi:DnaJ-class molecular chaperone
MANQQRIILAGAGDEEPGIPPGDVVFVLKQTPHDSFQRSGNDLLTAVHITLSEALFGFSRILVTHLDGRGIHVGSPPGKIIKPGESIVAKGEGMPAYKHPDTKGDMYIVFKIDMPGEEWLKTVSDRAVRSISFDRFPAYTIPSSNWRNFYLRSGLTPSLDLLLSMRHNSNSAISPTLGEGRSLRLRISLIMAMKTTGKTKTKTTMTNLNAQLNDLIRPTVELLSLARMFLGFHHPPHPLALIIYF